MLTKLTVRNFKRFEEVEIELGNAVVFVGPNNSGKTTALQALALWNIGVRRWNEKRKGKPSPEKRSGVTINRRDLISIPTPDANLLWRNLHVREVSRSIENGQKSQKTQNVRVDIIVEGVTNGKMWACGLEFDYANEESFYCRPLRTASKTARIPVPEEAEGIEVAFLPPMSGLVAIEPKWEAGRINVLLGEGQTAQVLRNLCYQIYEQHPSGKWPRLVSEIKNLFGVQLLEPNYIAERGEITMAYQEAEGGPRFDLSSSGRGLQQTLLLLAHLYANPGTVLLLDEPDAHLEILRQRQIYQLLTETANRQGSQLIAASHSEVVLNEAADRDIVVAFVGPPHRIDDRGSQVLKALKEIGFEQYAQAEQKGWVLYLEGATDLAILQTFARRLGHAAAACLESPFVCYVANQPTAVQAHFHGLREAKPDLVGIALFDRLDRELPEQIGASMISWRKREIENYLCNLAALRRYARHDLQDDLFGQAEAAQREVLMLSLAKDLIPPVAFRDPNHSWWSDEKVSTKFLDPLFEEYFRRLELPNLLRKSGYHRLAEFVAVDEIDPEVTEKLEAILEIARKAQPRS